MRSVQFEIRSKKYNCEANIKLNGEEEIAFTSLPVGCMKIEIVLKYIVE